MTIAQRGKEKICSSVFILDGVTHCFSFNGKKGMPLITNRVEAREYEYDLKRQLKAGTHIAESPLQNFTRFYDDVVMDYSREQKKEKTQAFDEYYGRLLKTEFGTRKLSQITPRMIEKFLLKLSKTKTQYDRFFSPVTVRMCYGRINQAFNLAIRERVTNDNPCRLVSPTVLKEFPTWCPRARWLNKYAADEEQRLFEELDSSLQTICRILLATGIRPPQEILGIEKEHVNLTDEARRFRFQKTDVLIPPQSVFVAKAKGGRTRSLPLSDSITKTFKVLCNDATTGKWLFLNREGKPLASIKKGFAAACERAGIEDLRPYDLRHTFATRLVERGVHMSIISALMGHAAPLSGFGHESRITPGYAHATWDSMRWAVESLAHEPLDLSVFELRSSKSQAKEAAGQDFAGIEKVG